MPKPTITDDQKHSDAQKADEQLVDESSPGGSAPEESEDIDETLANVGLPNDDEGPKELNSKEVIDKADKNQQ